MIHYQGTEAEIGSDLDGKGGRKTVNSCLMWDFSAVSNLRGAILGLLRHTTRLPKLSAELPCCRRILFRLVCCTSQGNKLDSDINATLRRYSELSVKTLQSCTIKWQGRAVGESCVSTTCLMVDAPVSPSSVLERTLDYPRRNFSKTTPLQELIDDPVGLSKYGGTYTGKHCAVLRWAHEGCTGRENYRLRDKDPNNIIHIRLR